MAAVGDIQTFETKYRKDGILHNGFGYTTESKRLADGSLLWKCVKRTCKARLQTDPEYRNPRLRGQDHDHLPDPEACAIRSTISRMRQRAETETTSIATIYQQESVQLAATPAAAAAFPSQLSLSSKLYRARRKR